MVLITTTLQEKLQRGLRAYYASSAVLLLPTSFPRLLATSLYQVSVMGQGGKYKQLCDIRINWLM